MASGRLSCHLAPPTPSSEERRARAAHHRAALVANPPPGQCYQTPNRISASGAWPLLGVSRSSTALVGGDGSGPRSADAYPAGRSQPRLPNGVTAPGASTNAPFMLPGSFGGEVTSKTNCEDVTVPWPWGLLNRHDRTEAGRAEQQGSEPPAGWPRLAESLTVTVSGRARILSQSNVRQ